VVNGIYIAAYYFGGTIGSWLPAEVYHRAGWDLFLVSVGFVLLLAAAGLWAMFRRVR
jgi:YNFM family putative membrane transporter